MTVVAAPPALRRIALAGNPNAGKTTLFNALTGLRQKVGNYPGVTVEKKEGRARLRDGAEATILDLPGTYSLTPKSPDEEVARDVLLGLRSDTPAPDAVLIVVDASNLERNLYLATQILELGLPCVVALNMIDVAASAGKRVDAGQLAHALGCPVFPVVAVKGEGLDALRAELAGDLPIPHPPALELPPALEAARTRLAGAIERDSDTHDDPTVTSGARGVALRLLCGNADAKDVRAVYGDDAAHLLEELRVQNKIRPSQEAAPRYEMLGALTQSVLDESGRELSQDFTDRADAILTHRVWGLLAFAAVVLLVFVSIFSLADWPMRGIEWLTTGAQTFLSDHLPGGPVRDLLVDGVVAGVGAVIVFLPQILILFFFLGILEDSGYMARAAFIMDKTMGRVGLARALVYPTSVELRLRDSGRDGHAHHLLQA